jgi:hypothetical protein
VFYARQIPFTGWATSFDVVAIVLSVRAPEASQLIGKTISLSPKILDLTIHVQQSSPSPFVLQLVLAILIALARASSRPIADVSESEKQKHENNDDH